MFRPLCLTLMLLITGCSQPVVEKFQGYAQGTSYHISYWSAEPVDSAALQQHVVTTFAEIDRALSNYRPDSDIEQFNQNTSTEPQTVGATLIQLIQQAQKTATASQGCYDLTFKPLFQLWGFGDDQLNVPDQSAIAQALTRVGMAKLVITGDDTLQKTQGNVHVDVSSIAQGYSVALIAEVLESFGLENYLVEIGGELVTRGIKPDGQAWRIAIERPLPDEQKLHKILTMPKDQPLAVMTSGTYRHFFDRDGQRYSHILDARSGRPVSHDTVLVTVIDADPVRADAWSTALLCLGVEQGLAIADEQNIAALFIQQQQQKLIESQSKNMQALGQLFADSP